MPTFDDFIEIVNKPQAPTTKAQAPPQNAAGRSSQAEPKPQVSETTAAIIGWVVLLAVLGLIWWLGAAVVGWLKDSAAIDETGPTGWYTDTECQAFYLDALSDTSSTSVDSAAMYEVHCE